METYPWCSIEENVHCTWIGPTNATAWDTGALVFHSDDEFGTTRVRYNDAEYRWYELFSDCSERRARLYSRAIDGSPPPIVSAEYEAFLSSIADFQTERLQTGVRYFAGSVYRPYQAYEANALFGAALTRALLTHLSSQKDPTTFDERTAQKATAVFDAVTAADIEDCWQTFDDVISREVAAIQKHGSGALPTVEQN